MPARSAESKGLIVTLVFFILSTIGLGVATYQVKKEQEDFKKAADDEKVKTQAANKELAWARYETAVYRAYLGAPTAEGSYLRNELKNDPLLQAKLAPDLKGDLNNPANAKKAKDIEEAKALFKVLQGQPPDNPAKAADIKKLHDKLNALYAELQKVQNFKAPDARKPFGDYFTWNQKDLKPTNDIFDLVDYLVGEVNALQDSVRQLRGMVDLARKDVATKETARADAEKRANDIFENGFPDPMDDKTQLPSWKQLLQTVDTLKADKKKLEDSLKVATSVKPAEIKDNLLKDIADRDTRIKGLVKENKDLKDKVETLELRVAVTKKDLKPLELKPRGRIVRVHRNGSETTIDLGSNDGLKPGVTFSVFAIGPNGKPKARPKGSVEVRSASPGQAVAVITTMYDPLDPGDINGKRKLIDVLSADNIDPIVAGDVLINPSWNPKEEVHVAIAGVVDLDGDGKDEVERFIRRLERQNVIVDAYIDTRDGDIKGPGMTFRTELLILADAPISGELAGAKYKDLADKISKQMGVMQKNAETLGIVTTKLRRFVEEAGYSY